MVSTTRTLRASPEQVWDVLADGWLYALWVVGASRMREVDDNWPEPGSKLHHSLGAWPILINDETEVIIDEDAVSGPGRAAEPAGDAGPRLARR